MCQYQCTTVCMNPGRCLAPDVQTKVARALQCVDKDVNIVTTAPVAITAMVYPVRVFTESFIS
jgi:hypothetical protein